MSEIVQGALIGIGGVVIGAFIAAISSYRIVELQINARRDEINQQQKHNEQEARIARLVRARENVLIPLRETLSKWMELAKQEQQMFVRLDVAYKRVKEANTEGNNAELEKELQLYKETSEKSQLVTSELAVFQGQTSDFSLDQIIEKAKKAFWETGPDRRELLRLFNNPQSIDTKSLLTRVEKYDSILNDLRSHLISANKRIEELISGDPSN